VQRSDVGGAIRIAGAGRRLDPAGSGSSDPRSGFAVEEEHRVLLDVQFDLVAAVGSIARVESHDDVRHRGDGVLRVPRELAIDIGLGVELLHQVDDG
jgi:hypothetical protein